MRLAFSLRCEGGVTRFLRLHEEGGRGAEDPNARGLGLRRGACLSLPGSSDRVGVEKQNTVVLGQMILEEGYEADIASVNRLIEAFPSDAPFADKKAAMARYAENSIRGKTFGISYVGKMDWCGLEHYVGDLHAYIGEKYTKNMLLVEVMTVGADFFFNLYARWQRRKIFKCFCRGDTFTSHSGQRRWRGKIFSM